MIFDPCFLGFSGYELNYKFDYWSFFWPSNSYFTTPNGKHKLTFSIYVSKPFQYYSMGPISTMLTTTCPKDFDYNSQNASHQGLL